MIDDTRPNRAVKVQCEYQGCEWSFWLDCLDPRLPDGPFICSEHDGTSNDEIEKEE